jgi:hypothetical protein
MESDAAAADAAVTQGRGTPTSNEEVLMKLRALIAPACWRWHAALPAQHEAVTATLSAPRNPAERSQPARAALITVDLDLSR